MRRNDSAGDVFVRVRSAAGASSTEPYKLRFRILPAGLVILSSNSYVDAGGLRHIIGDVITTADAFRSVKATATLYDSADALIGTASHRTMLRKLVQRTGLRSPFEIVFDPPPGYDHYTLTVSGIKANSEVLERLKIELKIPYTDDLDVGHFPGRLTNNNNFAIDSLEMFVTVYNAEARVINVGQAATNKVLVPKFDGTRFDATFVDHFASWNRFRAVAQAVVAP